MIFKLQHPDDLVSRLFILEYMKEIGANALYKKAKDTQKKEMFYKFIDETSNTEEIDINWEYCLFVAPLPMLDSFMYNFIDEIKKIEEQRQLIYEEQKELALKEEMSKEVDINIYDIAKTDMFKDRNKLIT